MAAKASSLREGHGGTRVAASQARPRQRADHAGGPSAASIDAPAVARAALELPLTLSDAQSELLARFVALLAKWNRVHNLTARESADDLLVLHLLDSLSIVEPLRAAVAPRSPAPATFDVLDVGSGGGLPGIPLAVVEPRARVTLLDKVAKKVAFLQQVKAELRLSNVECVAQRVEDFVPRASPTDPTPRRYDVITSRAYASLADFIAGSRHLLAEHGTWAAMKGAVPHDEIAALPADVVVRDIVKLRVPRLDAERHLIFLQIRPPR